MISSCYLLKELGKNKYHQYLRKANIKSFGLTAQCLFIAEKVI